MVLTTGEKSPQMEMTAPEIAQCQFAHRNEEDPARALMSHCISSPLTRSPSKMPGEDTH